jgi:L-fuculose-phosphate aldolase
MANNLDILTKQVLAVGRRMYERGYVSANDGNISVRIDDKAVLITPSGVSKGFMEPEDLLVLDMKGNLVQGHKKPSSESGMHIQIFKARPDVQCVCHAHPPYATAFAVAGIPLTKMILTEEVIMLGSVPVIEYGTPGTEELYQSISKYIMDYDAFLLANHGALSVGDGAYNAYHKMETLEHAAKIQVIAQQLGQVTELNPQQVRQLLGLRSHFGVRPGTGLKSGKPDSKK